MNSAEGIDVSAFQVDLVVHDLSGLSFAFTKATDGLSITDPHLGNNWVAIKAAGLHRGTYHELQAGHPGAQAAHFLAAVQVHGLEPGDMLAVVASDYPGVTDADVLTFCDAVELATKGLNPVLAYTDLSVGASLARTSAAGFGLWVAWPSLTAPGRLANWATWRLWQWGIRLVPGMGHVDADAYNGTPAQMTAWIGSFKPRPKPPPVVHDLVVHASGDDDMALILPNGAGATLALNVPADASELQAAPDGPASLRYMLDNSGAWVDWQVDANRSPNPVTLGAATVVRVERTDKGTNLVTVNWA